MKHAGLVRRPLKIGIQPNQLWSNGSTCSVRMNGPQHVGSPRGR